MGEPRFKLNENTLSGKSNPLILTDKDIIVHEIQQDYNGFPLASAGQRFLASLLDLIFFGAALKLVQSLMVFLDPQINPTNIAFLLAQTGLSLIFFYVPLYHSGQTLGKKIIGLQVVSRDGSQHLKLGQVFKREMFGKTVGLIFFFGYIMALMRKDRCGFHDLVGSTAVVAIK